MYRACYSVLLRSTSYYGREAPSCSGKPSRYGGPAPSTPAWTHLLDASGWSGGKDPEGVRLPPEILSDQGIPLGIPALGPEGPFAEGKEAPKPVQGIWTPACRGPIKL